MSWNSSTMIAAKRRCSRSRIPSFERRRSRALSCKSSKSSTPSRRFAASYSRAKPSSSAWSRSRSRTASSSSADCSTTLRASSYDAVRSLPRTLCAERSSRRSGDGEPARRSSIPAAFARWSSVALVSAARQRDASRSDSTRSESGARSPSSSTSSRPAERSVSYTPISIRRSAARPVRCEELQALRLLAGAELVERLRERLAGEHGRLRAVELAEARVEPRLERVGAKQARAEAVDGRDPGAVELAREVVASALAQLAPDARTQLTRGLARVRDHEDRADVDPAVAHRADEPLDEHGGLAGAGARREEDATVGLDRCLLLRVRGERAHGRRILHIGQSWHHCGHSPPRGSCRTSPARMRCASPRALSRAVSTWRQNASSST